MLILKVRSFTLIDSSSEFDRFVKYVDRDIDRPIDWLRQKKLEPGLPVAFPVPK